jgi:glycosyltransferase involved in cell wall biosynthesis
MKQLVVTASFPFTSQTFVMREVASAFLEGDDVHVLAPTTGDAVGAQHCVALGFPADRAIYLNYAECPPFSLHPLRFTRRVAHAARRSVYGRLLAERRKSFFAKLLRDPRVRGAEMIHAHFVSWSYRVAVPLAKLLQVPLTITAHDVELLPQMDTSILREVQEAADVLTVVSSEYRRYWVERTGDDAKLRVVHNGVDLSEFERAVPPVRSGSRLRLITVSRLAPHKRIADGLHALRAVVDRGVDAEYTVVGDGPERPALEALRDELGLTDRVNLLGFVPRARVVDELASSDILVHPSEAEGFGVAVTEGMAARLPVVVARSGGVLDIVEHGRFGFLYEPGDLEALAGRLVELARDGGKRSAFGRVAREVVAARFSWEKHMVEIRRAWSDALAACPNASRTPPLGS